MLRTCQSSRILLDCVHSLPFLRLGECNNIAPNASKAVNQYSLIWRGCFGNMPRDGSRILSMHSKCIRSSLPCDWLWSHTEPSIFRHPYPLIVLREDAKALMVISAKAFSEATQKMHIIIIQTSGHPKASRLVVHNAGSLSGAPLPYCPLSSRCPYLRQ